MSFPRSRVVCPTSIAAILRRAARRRRGASAELLALAPLGRGPCHARGNGFGGAPGAPARWGAGLHAAVVVPPRDPARLERLCRYALRPPIATDRLHLTADGQVVLDLRHRWADGTRLLFEPVELLERLAALTPRPRTPGVPDARFPARWGGSLLLHCGVLGARSAWRSRLQAREPDTPITGSSRSTRQGSTIGRMPSDQPARIFGIDRKEERKARESAYRILSRFGGHIGHIGSQEERAR